MNAILEKPGVAHLELLVKQVRMEATGINSYELVSPDGAPLPPFTAGAHIDIHVAPGVIRQYSLSNSPSERHRYVIAVLKDLKGRGGSTAVHENIRVGDTVRISAPRNNFELLPAKGKVYLLAGGIGVTPMKSMAHQLEAEGIPYELYYCSRGSEFAAFQEELNELAISGKVKFHFDGGDPGNSLDISTLLESPEEECHLYYCGPGGFMEACRVASQHWPTGTVHFEHFKAPIKEPSVDVGSEGAFIAEIRSTGEKLQVSPDQNLAEVLQQAGYPIETSCLSGLCGTCKIGYIEGEVDHQDFILDDSERGRCLTACVSRAKSSTLLLDL